MQVPSDEPNAFYNAMLAIWTALLSIGVGFMSYFAKKRDSAIDENDAKIDAHGKAMAALELKIAENYATKITVLSLFQEATSQTKEAVARVEKSVENTNLSVGKLDIKIDKVVDSITEMAKDVMKELSKKT